MTEGIVIGIDLGTTYSCVACWNDKTQKVEVIPTASGRTMPSWVGFTPQGKVVGSAAKSQASSNPTNTVFDVKRILGRSFFDSVTQDEIKQFPFSVQQGDNGETLITVDWRGETKGLSPEQVSAMVLSELRHEAERHLGSPIKDAVITVPAHFNNQQRQATKDAGRIAGLNVRRIINEPTAAALAYGLHDSSATDKGNVVIFDLGGGTFDVTCLTMNEGVLEVRATGGDTHLGGEDFDNALIEWCFEQIKQQHESISIDKLRQNLRAVSRLKQAVEGAKKSLSSSLSVDVEVDSLIANVDFRANLSRAVFEEVNAALFQRCLDTVKSVLVDAKVEINDVSDVVLVGGSTRVPFLQSALHEMFGGHLQLCKSVHPDEAVAVGAAVQGRILSTGGSGGGQDLLQETCQDLLLLDVTPLSLGIELEGRTMSTLIKRNTAIPCKKTRTYTTVENYQSSIDVVVYEGERPSIDANNKLGSFVISGVQRAPAGEPKVDVTFSLDANGILNVSAQDQVTGARAQATIKAEKGRLSEDDIERMIEEAEHHRAQDAELAKKTAYKTALEEALLSAQSNAGDADLTELEELMDWLELDSDDATLEEMKNRGHALEDKFGVVVSASS